MAKIYDYYVFLKIRPDATQEQIKRICRQELRKCHPDLHPGDKAAEARCKSLTRIMETLTDPGRRKKYDEQLRAWKAAAQKQNTSAPPKPSWGSSASSWSAPPPSSSGFPGWSVPPNSASAPSPPPPAPSRPTASPLPRTRSRRTVVAWMVSLATLLFLAYHGLTSSSDDKASNSKSSVVRAATPDPTPAPVDASRLVALLFAVPFARNDSGQIWLKNGNDTTRTWVEPKDLENWLRYGWRSAVDLSLCSFDMPFQCAGIVGNRTLVDGAGQPFGCSRCCLDLESTEVVRHCATWTLSGRKVLQQRQEGKLEVLATDEKTVVGFITHNTKGQPIWTPKRRPRPRQKCDPVLRDGATACQSNDQCVAPVKCVRGLCCGL
jgi:curved DNA-binding protein CbpA